MPFIKCPDCGKVNSVKLKNCPKCEAPLDAARAAYYNAQSPDTQAQQPAPAQQPAWGQTPQQPQHNPWGQPQTAPRPQDNPWAQHQQSPQQPQNNPWGQPQTTPRPQNNPWASANQAQAAQPQSATAFCPACGTQLANGARFCPSCGAPVPPPAQAVPGIPTRKNPYSL